MQESSGCSRSFIARFGTDAGHGGFLLMNEMSDETMLFRMGRDQTNVGRVLREVHEALVEKGYDPVSQIVGYLLSGDPTYITSHRNARGLIRSIERDEIIEELVRFYIQTA